jgi:hypothetical protein
MSTAATLPERFIDETTLMVQRKRHFSVEMLEPKIRQRIQREWLDSGVSHEDVHEQLCREFFLPFFARSGFCLLSGATPAEITPHAGGFQAVPHEVGWELRTKVGSTGEFPYWRPALGLPLYQLLVPVDLRESVDTMEQMLGRAWDPIVSTNPHALFLTRGSFDFVKQTTARSATQVWLRYSVVQHTLRVVIFGSGGTVAGLYGTALREANISENYYGRYYGRRS